MYTNPGGTIIVPMLVPAKYPMAHPIAVDVTPTVGPIRILTANMIMGAKFMVESGGGNGMAIIVVTAINAAMTPVNATFFDGE